MKIKWFFALIFCLFLVLPPSAAFADQGAPSVEALVRLLQQKGLLNEQEAEEFLKELFTEASEVAEEQTKDAAQKPVSDSVQQDMEKASEKLEQLDNRMEWMIQRSGETQVRLGVVETRMEERIIPEMDKSRWAQKIRWGGDARLRWQRDMFDSKNALLLKPSDPTQIMNTRQDRDRMRLRARVYLKASDLADPMEKGKLDVGIRLTTGNEKEPVSTNETLGDYMNRDTVVLDQAYIRWTYRPDYSIWSNRIPSLSLVGGRFENPWVYTDLVWDSDINFEGIALQFKTESKQNIFNRFDGFITAGIFPLQEVEFSSRDKWLKGIQAGASYSPLSRLMRLKAAAAYYHYSNIQGQVNDPRRPGELDYTAPLFQQKGNTLFDIDPVPGSYKLALAADYRLLNFNGLLEMDYFFPVRISLIADYVVNIGFEREKTAALTGVSSIEAQTTGYQFGMKVGYPSLLARGDWRLFLYYKHLERDAVLDAFTDSDFHLGGTDCKGWVIGGALGLTRNLSLDLRYLTSDEISGPPLAIDTLQVDVNASY